MPVAREGSSRYRACAGREAYATLARRRFFVDSIHNGFAELHGDEARHLTRALRVQPGQRFEITDNRNPYLAEIAEARGERVVFRVLEPVESKDAPVRVTLLAALFKFDRFEWLVEKATELGVERIVPIEAARTEKGLFEASQKRVERWRRIAREASEQSRRTRMPEIAAAVQFSEAIRTPASIRLFLDEDETAPLLLTLPAPLGNYTDAALLLGPEGGWTEAERESARNAGWIPASLGTQILRAETAGIAALAILVNAWMV